MKRIHYGLAAALLVGVVGVSLASSQSAIATDPVGGPVPTPNLTPRPSDLAGQRAPVVPKGPAPYATSAPLPLRPDRPSVHDVLPTPVPERNWTREEALRRVATLPSVKADRAAAKLATWAEFEAAVSSGKSRHYDKNPNALYWIVVVEGTVNVGAGDAPWAIAAVNSRTGEPESWVSGKTPNVPRWWSTLPDRAR